MSSKPEGDSKVQELRRRCQSLCAQDLDELKKQELGQKVESMEEQWSSVVQRARGAVEQAERECSVETQLRGFRELSRDVSAWLQDKRQSLTSVEQQSDLEQSISTAQVSLSCKTPEHLFLINPESNYRNNQPCLFTS